MVIKRLNREDNSLTEIRPVLIQDIVFIGNIVNIVHFCYISLENISVHASIFQIVLFPPYLEVLDEFVLVVGMFCLLKKM